MIYSIPGRSEVPKKQGHPLHLIWFTFVDVVFVGLSLYAVTVFVLHFFFDKVHEFYVDEQWWSYIQRKDLSSKWLYKVATPFNKNIKKCSVLILKCVVHVLFGFFSKAILNNYILVALFTEYVWELHYRHERIIMSTVSNFIFEMIALISSKD